MIHEVASLVEMKSLASEIASRLPQRALILLSGPMAAGKTQFTKFLIEAMGQGPDSSDEVARSPSFALHHSYLTARGSVEHFDLFRLENADDLESIGFWDFFRDREGVIVIEWCERLREFGLEGSLPLNWPRIKIAIEPSADSASVGAISQRRRVSVD